MKLKKVTKEDVKEFVEKHKKEIASVAVIGGVIVIAYKKGCDKGYLRYLKETSEMREWYEYTKPSFRGLDSFKADLFATGNDDATRKDMIGRVIEKLGNEDLTKDFAGAIIIREVKE